VRAVNKFGLGALSSASNAVTPAAVVASAPTGVSASAPTAVNGVISSTVRWNAPVSNGGSAITGSQIDVRIGSTVAKTVTFNDAATSHVITDLVKGTTYTFVVRAVNAVGASPSSVASAAVTTPREPGAPTIGAARQGVNRGPITAIANWTAPGATGGSPITGYQVKALRMSSGAANATVLGTTTSAVLPATARSLEMTLTANPYRFVVVAINGVGPSADSARSGTVTPR